MKKFCSKLLVVTAIACAVVLAGCGRKMPEHDGKKQEQESKKQEKEAAYEASIISDYEWQASGDGSLIVCNEDGTFKYYRSAEDLTDSYYEGTYEFYIGEDAVTYVTKTLSDYGITEDELEDLFDRNEEYDESNFVCLVLNNEKCIIGGENQIESPYKTPYYGFCLEDDEKLCLDIANMNTANYALYVAK